MYKFLIANKSVLRSCKIQCHQLARSIKSFYICSLADQEIYLNQGSHKISKSSFSVAETSYCQQKTRSYNPILL